MMMKRAISKVFVPALALALPLVMSSAAWAEAVSNLSRIDFDASSTITDIRLFSDRPVAYRTVSATDKKLIIDFDQLTSRGTVDTHFNSISQHTAINNVVIQPLNDHAVRLIIRGENLAVPQISFAESAQAAQARVAAPAPASRNLLSESLDDGPIDTAALPVEGADNALFSDSSLADVAPIATAAIATPAAGGAAPIAQLDGASDNQRPQQPASAHWISRSIGWMNQWHLVEIAQYGLLTLLLLGLGWFIKRKIDALNEANADQNTHVALEDLLAQRQHGRSLGFREIAQAYQANADEYLASDEPVAIFDDEQIIASHPGSNNPDKRNVRADSLIGLRGLSQRSAADLGSQIDRLHQKANAQMPPLSSRPQAPIKKQPEPPLPAARKTAAPAPARQAINPYAQQQRPAVGGKSNAAQPVANRQRKVSDEALRQELGRARDVKNQAARLGAPALPGARSNNAANANRTPVNQAQAALRKNTRPATDLNGADPNLMSGNPQVLDFLRDVANLMEKDGRGDMARSIQKNIRPM